MGSTHRGQVCSVGLYIVRSLHFALHSIGSFCRRASPIASAREGLRASMLASVAFLVTRPPQVQSNTRNLEDVFRANERSSSSLEIMQAPPSLHCSGGGTPWRRLTSIRLLTHLTTCRSFLPDHWHLTFSTGVPSCTCLSTLGSTTSGKQLWLSAPSPSPRFPTPVLSLPFL